MTTPDELTLRLRKLTGKASRLKLDLHDLAEDLPSNWEQIPELAARTYDAYAEIDRLKKQLAEGSAT
ncbi:MAG TPA: CCE_0567 family metalloprotein [Pseudonocardiaceae bacterium]